MEEFIEYMIKNRHQKDTKLRADLEDYKEMLMEKYPNDADLGAYLKKY
mgnify:CR=1 FL=1